MSLNWFTVIAQIVNFLILVWLLKRFLYAPILSAIEAREAKIASRIEESEHIKKDATIERESYTEKNEQFDKEKTKMLENAVKEVDEKRAELLEKARTEVKDMRDKFNKSLQDEYEQLGTDISDKISMEVLAVIRTTLATLANEDLEQKIISVFVELLQKTDQKAWDALKEAMKADDKSLNVRSAFEMTEAQKDEIIREVKGKLGEKMKIHFSKAPEIISGIEVSADGYKIAWSISDYVASVEKSIQAIIANATKG